jgi:hypothetical protein
MPTTKASEIPSVREALDRIEYRLGKIKESVSPGVAPDAATAFGWVQLEAGHAQAELRRARNLLDGS